MSYEKIFVKLALLPMACYWVYALIVLCSDLIENRKSIMNIMFNKKFWTKFIQWIIHITIVFYIVDWLPISNTNINTKFILFGVILFLFKFILILDLDKDDWINMLRWIFKCLVTIFSIILCFLNPTIVGWTAIFIYCLVVLDKISTISDRLDRLKYQNQII
jgi:hypothetical protein